MGRPTSEGYVCVCLCRCTNAESYIIARLPDLIGSDPATLNKSIALADYYFYNQGGGVKDILKSVAGVNLDDVFATVNSTRDQAVQVETPQNCHAGNENSIDNVFLQLSEP